jgi:hypothetical protein
MATKFRYHDIYLTHTCQANYLLIRLFRISNAHWEYPLNLSTPFNLLFVWMSSIWAPLYLFSLLFLETATLISVLKKSIKILNYYYMPFYLCFSPLYLQLYLSLHNGLLHLL